MGLQKEIPLPTTRREMERWGWQEIDVLLVTGDAYVDHPAFGVALLGRWLVDHGYRAGIIAQPRWDNTDDVTRLGRPRLFAGVTAGALDSMLAARTAFRAPRRTDAYSPGGETGLRPNRASIVYANLVRRAFPGLPVVLGGIEASLRRITHYDFWSDSLRRPALVDAKADLLLFGMAERAMLELARRLEAGQSLAGMRGTATVGEAPDTKDVVELPPHEAITADPWLLMEATLALERQAHNARSWAVQPVGGRNLVLAPPQEPLTTEELDRLHGLPFTRAAASDGDRAIPAVEMLQTSVTSHRGCAGGCAFCSLALHQGRAIRSRSPASILAEVERLTRLPGWRGSISDVGGPSANMYGSRCEGDRSTCKRTSCLAPSLCEDFRPAQEQLAALLRDVADQAGVKHVRVASGVRHDLALESPEYLAALVGEFTGGQLKLAPEHSCDRVLRLMRKPRRRVFDRFLTIFKERSAAAGKEQYVVPYLMSAFPGCTDRDMRELARWLTAQGWRPKQVQCFVPTPGTVATAMFVTGRDTRGRTVPVARTDAERLRQHRILTEFPGQKVAPR
jgi:uncharacterized radical SAM protein YgiQ